MRSPTRSLRQAPKLHKHRGFTTWPQSELCGHVYLPIVADRSAGRREELLVIRNQHHATPFRPISQDEPECGGLKERNACVDTIQSNPAGLPSGSLGFSLLHEGRHHALP
jgi:hypothetical protein